MSDKNWSAARQRLKQTDAPKPATSPSKPLPPKRENKAPFEIKPAVAFYVFLASHIFAAIFSPIQDCDETFNYWEPTHYLNHGHGFQTWEYSPDYAIRSWTYAGLHATVISIGKLLPFIRSRAAEFYFLRLVLALVCALCETRLYSKIGRALNSRVAILFMLITATSPGMYHASIAYLPSSFAMYATILGMAAFMDWRGGMRTAQGIWCFGVGASLGWPFAAALSIPFLLEELFLASLSDHQGQLDLFWRIVDGVVRTLIVLGFQVGIDGFFYKKKLVVPLNIIFYNVFSSKGPELYGTEPWSFYIRNLALNFHVWLPLAVISIPLLLAQHFLRAKGTTKSSYLRGVVFLSPFYLWLAIFTLQPHKEERFMYPAYPAIALNAAISMHIILANLGSSDSKDLISRIPVQLRLLFILAFTSLTVIVSAFRIIGTMTAYGAPLSIYSPLSSPELNLTTASTTTNLCLGKEWYRFPSHYLLPENVHAKFIKSEFSGLLPGEFSEAGHGFGLFPGTWLVPTGMNDENREDVGKYTDVRHCGFLVDSSMPSVQATAQEPSYVDDEETWEKVKCVPFMDAGATGIVGRLGWVPDLPFVPQSFKRVWGEYCLLKRRRRS